MIKGKGYIECNANDRVMVANVYQEWCTGRMWYGSANPLRYQVDTDGMRGYRVRITKKPLLKRLLFVLKRAVRS